MSGRSTPHHPDFIKVWFIHREGEDLAAQEAIVAATAEAAHAAHLSHAVQVVKGGVVYDPKALIDRIH